ncbi:MAG TPA: hypothetical protein VH761_02405 [Ilumatobacteraceae bacterium]|jgi:hypothetical protein
MNIQTRIQTATDTLPFAKTGSKAGRIGMLGWIALVLAVPMIVAVAVALNHDGSAKDSPATVHATGKVEPLIGPEEQAFIDHLRLARVPSVAPAPVVESTFEPLVGPEEQAFIDQMHRAPMGPVVSAGRVSAAVPRFVAFEGRIDRCALARLRCGLR